MCLHDPARLDTALVCNDCSGEIDNERDEALQLLDRVTIYFKPKHGCPDDLYEAIEQLLAKARATEKRREATKRAGRRA